MNVKYVCPSFSKTKKQKKTHKCRNSNKTELEHSKRKIFQHFNDFLFSIEVPFNSLLFIISILPFFLAILFKFISLFTFFLLIEYHSSLCSILNIRMVRYAINFHYVFRIVIIDVVYIIAFVLLHY